MIEFACPGCGRRIKVKDEMAGRKGKCPHCACAAVVPAPSAALAESRTPSPRPAAEEATAPPPPAGDSPRDTQSEADATNGPTAVRPSDPMTDFLSPPQCAGEIGRLGPYRILKVLGAGGMGVVFQAEDPSLMRLVALKAMLPGLASSAAARERFVREARSAAAVEHDHIVAVYQVGEDQGVPYLVMPFLRGEPLDVRLKREKRLATAEVLRIAREAATGLEAARQRGMIHRDIKPANLWLEEGTGRVKVLDFGLARAADDTGHLTQQGAILGTPAYMAPEQAGGTADHRADLFSLGCVMYRMATGEAPFKGTDAISTLMAVATEPARSPLEINPALPAALGDLILRLLAKKPEQRPASAQAVVEAIRGIEAAPRSKTKTGAQPGVQTAARSKAKTGPPAQRKQPAAAASSPARPTAAKGQPPKRRGRGALWLGLTAMLLVAGLSVGGYFALPYLHLPGIRLPFVSGPTPTPDKKDVAGGSTTTNANAEAPWQPLFNGQDLNGWLVHKGKLDNWRVDNGVLFTHGMDHGWLMTEASYGDFDLRLEYRITARAHAGVAIRAPLEGDPSFTGLEIPLIDDRDIKNVKPNEMNGALFGLAPPMSRTGKPPGDWNQLYIVARGRELTVDLNGVRTLSVNLDKFLSQSNLYSGVTRTNGRIGLHSHTNRAEFRDISVRPVGTAKDDGKGP